MFNMVYWAWIDSEGLCVAHGQCAEENITYAVNNVPSGLSYTTRPQNVTSRNHWYYDSVAETWTQILPPGPTLNDLKTEKIRVLDTIAEKKREFFVYDGEPEAFCEVARSAVNEAIAFRNLFNITTAAEWQLGRVSWRMWDLNDLILYAGAIGLWVQQNFNYKKQLADQILAATTDTELNSIDITAGWP